MESHAKTPEGSDMDVDKVSSKRKVGEVEELRAATGRPLPPPPPPVRLVTTPVTAEQERVITNNNINSLNQTALLLNEVVEGLRRDLANQSATIRTLNEVIGQLLDKNTELERMLVGLSGGASPPPTPPLPPSGVVLTTPMEGEGWTVKKSNKNKNKNKQETPQMAPPSQSAPPRAAQLPLQREAPLPQTAPTPSVQTTAGPTPSAPPVHVVSPPARTPFPASPAQPRNARKTYLESLKAKLPEEIHQAIAKVRPTAEESTHSVGILTVRTDFNPQAMQNYHAALTEGMRAYFGHTPLQVVRVGPKTAEIYYDQRYARALDRPLPHWASLVTNPVPKDLLIDRRARGYLRGYFKTLRRAALQDLSRTDQAKVLDRALSFLPKMTDNLVKLSTWKRTLQFDRKELEEAVKEEARVAEVNAMGVEERKDAVEEVEAQA